MDSKKLKRGRCGRALNGFDCIDPKMDMIIIIHHENLNIYAIIKLFVYNGITYVYKKGKSRKENVKEGKM